MKAGCRELSLRPLDRTGDRSRPFDHRGEHVTADAGHGQLRDGSLQVGAKLGQYRIRGRVAEAVGDNAETIDAHKDDGDSRAVLLGSVQSEVDAVF